MNSDPAEPDSLVVDLTEIDAVLRVLEELAIAVDSTEELPAFDLGLVRLAGEEFADVDPVLAELRARFTGRCAGWTPLLGKNRRMASVFGAYPQTKSMSLWDPVALDETTAALTFDGDAGSGVRVGLLDTRIYRHPGLAGRHIETSDSTTLFDKDAKTSYSVEEGHGVFTAGLIFQQAPGATLVARHVLREDGKAFAWEVVKKLAEFFDDEHRVDVLVLASGCRNTLDGNPPAIIHRAIERLSAHMLIVAAAGNHGALEGMTSDAHITRNSATWPAALPRVVAVGVTDADYSPDLPWVTCTVDPKQLHAQDDDSPPVFVSTYLDAPEVQMHEQHDIKEFTGYASWVGTSGAAAVVGGAVAARIVPGTTAEQALNKLYEGSVVQPYAWPRHKSG